MTLIELAPSPYFFVLSICLAYMNMFARFDENPAMTLQDIKKTKRYGRTDGRTHRQRENSIPTTNKVCVGGGGGGYKNIGRIKGPDALAVCRAHRGLPVGFLLLRYSV